MRELYNAIAEAEQKLLLQPGLDPLDEEACRTFYSTPLFSRLASEIESLVAEQAMPGSKVKFVLTGSKLVEMIHRALGAGFLAGMLTHVAMQDTALQDFLEVHYGDRAAHPPCQNLVTIYRAGIEALEGMFSDSPKQVFTRESVLGVLRAMKESPTVSALLEGRLPPQAVMGAYGEDSAV